MYGILAIELEGENAANGGREGWKGKWGGLEPHPRAARCPYGCHHCTCSAPGTRRTQTACSWTLSLLPAQIEISSQTSAIGEERNHLERKGVNQSLSDLVPMSHYTPDLPGSSRLPSGVLVHSIPEPAIYVPRTLAFCSSG